MNFTVKLKRRNSCKTRERRTAARVSDVGTGSVDLEIVAEDRRAESTTG